MIILPADEAGGAETQEELEMKRRNRLQKMKDRPISAVIDSTTRSPGKPISARSVGDRRLRMARGSTVDSGAADPVMPRRMSRGRGNKIRPSQASRAGVHYVSATANRIKNEGETDLHFDTLDGKKFNWTFHIAEVALLPFISAAINLARTMQFSSFSATFRAFSTGFAFGLAFPSSLRLCRLLLTFSSTAS